jgi:exosortase B
LATATLVQRNAPPSGTPESAPRSPAVIDRPSVTMLGLGLLLLYVPTLWDWVQGTWSTETQGHEFVILAVSGWLLYRQRQALARIPVAASSLPGDLLLALGLAIYFVGRSQQILRLELLSLTVVLGALVLRYKGRAGLGQVWFPLLFQLFAMPLPFQLVLTLTGPLKTGASAVATWLLSALGYPVGRSGVVMTIGQYQLLVTEACAGLQTMFTLEAMGLLYASLMHHGSALRNVLLAALVVPVSFAANVVRVVALALVTFHFGDAAGQGFLHGFAGVLLFLVALAFIAGLDRLLGVLLARVRT